MLCKCCDSPEVSEQNTLTLPSEPDILVKRFSCLVCGCCFAIRYSLDADTKQYKEIKTIFSKGSTPLQRGEQGTTVTTGSYKPANATVPAPVTVIKPYIQNKIRLEEAEELNHE